MNVKGMIQRLSVSRATSTTANGQMKNANPLRARLIVHQLQTKKNPFTEVVVAQKLCSVAWLGFCPSGVGLMRMIHFCSFYSIGLFDVNLFHCELKKSTAIFGNWPLKNELID
ncbi:hypothetical protein T07_9298 [Trichinella nelsoni]|uniref:Uncharacterized protein n=1 Tax=Trichinella nelsoni TaxID=6336 RepID=A0A0V0SI49_9BILA|nr:hypothetical protein T07_9298 [Trichinella nelsoni]